MTVTKGSLQFLGCMRELYPDLMRAFYLAYFSSAWCRLHSLLFNAWKQAGFCTILVNVHSRAPIWHRATMTSGTSIPLLQALSQAKLMAILAPKDYQTYRLFPYPFYHMTSQRSISWVHPSPHQFHSLSVSIWRRVTYFKISKQIIIDNF